MSVQTVSPERAVEVLTIELESKKDKIAELKAKIAEQAATIARLTAANESMQEDAVQNTYAFNLMLTANKEQAAEIAQLTEKVRYAYVQIEALEAK